MGVRACIVIRRAEIPARRSSVLAFFLCLLLPSARVESRNNLETYLYNLKSSYEDDLKDKITDLEFEELRSAVESGLEVHQFLPPGVPLVGI